MTVPLVSGVAPLADAYDGFILDLWGVVHDGAAPYPGVLDCLRRLRAAGKRIVLLSNAPRLAPRAAAVLRRMGLDDALYDRLVTSGDATRAAFESLDDPWYAALGRRYLFLGKPADADLLDGLGYAAVDDLAAADFLLDTGLAERADGGKGEVDDYRDVLRRAAARGLPMVCANPDLAAIRAGASEACAGALAAAYAALGGAVGYRGKPYPEVYELCFAALDGVARDRVLAVGDSLATDIAGAGAVGLDSLLVTGGLLAHAWGLGRETPPDPARLAAACADAGAIPTAAIPRLVW
ncbi:MAG: TIGR01459 family HAD-type hydrolase [Alphaproteobacteria bacterium]